MSKESDKENPLRLLYQRIIDVSDSIVPLYDAIQNKLFDDIEYYDFIGCVPMWMSDAGRCAESTNSKAQFEKFVGGCKDKNSFKLLYWFDLQGLLSAMQDRICDIRSLLCEFYKILPYENEHKMGDYSSASRNLNESATHAQALANNIFVSLASAFDLYSKICYEVYNMDDYAFDKYTKLKSRKNNILFARSLRVNEDLKAEGLLLSEPICVRKVLSFRDEFIHNGSWDYRSAIYETIIDDEPSDVFMLCPDMEEDGCFVTSGARNKFYSQDNRINILLISLVNEVLDVFDISIEALIEVCQKETKECNDEERKKNAKRYITRLICETGMTILEELHKRK